MWRACLVLTLACLLTGCGDEPETLTAEGYRQRGDASFTAGDHLLEKHKEGGLDARGAETTLAEAVRAYVDAGNDLIRAFRMEDPLPERREQRALLAFRVGRALSTAAQHGVTHPYRERLAERAVFWFGEARAIEDQLIYATFEQAVLFESDILTLRDLVRAREAYRRFLEDAAGREDDTAVRIRKRAEARVEALDAQLSDPLGG